MYATPKDAGGPRSVTPSEDLLVDIADSLHRSECGIKRDRLLALAQIDDRGAWEYDGFDHVAQWVAARYGVSVWKATRMVTAGHALRYLPLTSAHFAAGKISEDKVLELCRFAAPETERELIEWAAGKTTRAIRNRADAECRPDLEATKEVVRMRKLEWEWSDDKTMLSFWGFLPAHQGAAFVHAIDSVVKGLEPLPSDTEELSGEPDAVELQDGLRADALMQLVTEGSSSAERPASAPGGTVVVHAPWQEVLSPEAVRAAEAPPSHELGTGEIEGGGLLHPPIVDELMCSWRVQRILYDGTVVVGVDREQRDPPRWLRRAVFRRDGHCCTFPGCSNDGFLITHHIEAWVPRGKTNENNLVTVCSRHHDLIHLFHWKVRLDAQHKAEWFRPNGERYLAGPAPPPRTRRPKAALNNF